MKAENWNIGSKATRGAHGIFVSAFAVSVFEKHTVNSGGKLFRCIRFHTVQKARKRISMEYSVLPVCVVENATGL
jgi:hypothetical protein